MTKLTGSEKQIAWANSLRDKYLNELEEMKEEVFEDDGNQDAWNQLNELVLSLTTSQAMIAIQKISFFEYCFVDDYTNGYGKHFFDYVKKEEKIYSK